MPSLSSFLPTVKPAKSFSTRNAVIPLYPALGIHGGEQDEQARFLGVGDPQLAPVEDVVAALELGFRGQRESVGAAAGFAQRVRAHRFRRQFRQVALFLLFVAPAQQGVVDQRVLHVHHNAGGGVHARQFLDGENGFEECSGAATELLGNLDTHQAELEELVNQRVVEHAFLVHFAGERRDLFFREPADVVAKELLVFGERQQRRGSFGAWCGDFGHGGSL